MSFSPFISLGLSSLSSEELDVRFVCYLQYLLFCTVMLRLKVSLFLWNSNPCQRTVCQFISSALDLWEKGIWFLSKLEVRVQQGHALFLTWQFEHIFAKVHWKPCSYGLFFMKRTVSEVNRLLCGCFANLAWSLKDSGMCLLFNLTSVNQAHSIMYVYS